MRALILVAGAALAVAACSSNEAADNTMVEDNLATDLNTTDMNAMTDMNAVDANMMTGDVNLTTTGDVNVTEVNTDMTANNAM